MALDLEHFNADPWDLNDIVPNDIEVIYFQFLTIDRIVSIWQNCDENFDLYFRD